MRAPDPRWLVGRTIVGYTNGTDDENVTNAGEASHDPTIILDNGARLTFIAEELESGDGYGIFPMYLPPRKERKR